MENACDRLKAELSAFIDGQLEEKVQIEVETHIDECQLCSSDLNSLRSLDQLMESAKDVSMPDLWDSIQEQMPSMCELMLDELSAFLDGELPPAAQEGVNIHLKECPPCLDSFNALSYANQAIAKALILPDDLEIDLWPAVQAQMDADCALIKSELSDFVDQEVTNQRHRNITSHIVDCPECRNDFEQLSLIGDTLREFYQPKLDDKFDLWPEVRSQLQVVPFASKTASAVTIQSETGAQKPAANNVRSFLSRRSMAMAAAAAVSIGVLGWGGMSMMVPKAAQASPMSAEAYLIESALMEPAEVAEAAVYEQN